MPDFPPLFCGRVTADDPVASAVAAARSECEAGLILYRPSETEIEAALVLAPDVPLEDAAAMLLVAGNGFADAFGALAPPEVALHLDWPAGIRIEGARCGAIRGAAPPCPPDAVPGWMVLGLRIAVAPDGDREPGERPGETAMRAEGVTVAPDDLLAAWTRHTLSWIVRWEDEGLAPVQRAWTARAWGRGEACTLDTRGGSRTGLFQGLDERGGMLLKVDEGTTLVPLTAMLDRPC